METHQEGGICDWAHLEAVPSGRGLLVMGVHQWWGHIYDGTHLEGGISKEGPNSDVDASGRGPILNEASMMFSNLEARLIWKGAHPCRAHLEGKLI